LAGEIWSLIVCFMFTVDNNLGLQLYKYDSIHVSQPRLLALGLRRKL
jgi:hypothetical protein